MNNCQRCRRERQFVEDLRVCTIHMHNGDETGLPPRRRAIVRALNSLVTPRQRFCLYLYYGRHMSQRDIAAELGVDDSTVSRNITNGERNLRSVELLFNVEAEQAG